MLPSWRKKVSPLSQSIQGYDILITVLTLQYVHTDMSPQGELSVEESSTGIVKVSLDPKAENGEFYSVSARLTSILINSGMVPNIRGELYICEVSQYL